MSSRTSIQQVVSTSAPVGAALGDEWYDPTVDKLYKRTVLNNTAGWTDMVRTGASGVVSITSDLSVVSVLETVSPSGIVGSAVTLSVSSGTMITATLTSSTACTFTMPTPVAGRSFTLMLRQPSTGTAATATFSNVKWATAGAPFITATVGRMDILTFVADGASWYGSYAQGYTY